jgi:pimeloyl-ACP methyl ester carboxylesterase
MAYQETVVRRDQHRIHVRDHPGAEPPIMPSGYAYTSANQVGDLDAVITQLGLEQVLLVAHDASGPPAIDWALAQPISSNRKECIH